MAKDTPVKLKTLWAGYCQLIARSQTLFTDTLKYDRLIGRMASLEQALATTPALSLDELVIKLDLLAWILFPSAEPGARAGVIEDSDNSGPTTSRGTPLTSQLCHSR